MPDKYFDEQSEKDNEIINFQGIAYERLCREVAVSSKYNKKHQRSWARNWQNKDTNWYKTK